MLVVRSSVVRDSCFSFGWYGVRGFSSSFGSVGSMVVGLVQVLDRLIWCSWF